jgi:TonB family protein
LQYRRGTGPNQVLHERKPLVLASEEDGGTLQTLKFSLASDIVELLVLTCDEVFLQTLHEAVGGASRLWHVLSADKVSDRLVAGQVGIVVLDVQALHEAASVFVVQIKRQFPDLVVVAAGLRDDEALLAGLISAGLVYRFIHKPMSPARAKLFAQAAINKYEEQRRRAAAAPLYKRAAPASRAWRVACMIGALALIAATAWMVHRSGGEEVATTPAGELANNPADADARAGLAEVHEQLLARAENALLEERLNEAAAAIETARKSGVDGSRVAFLTAQLAKSREQIKAARAQVEQQKRAQSVPKAKENLVTPLLTLTAQRSADGHLEPDHEGAAQVPASIDTGVDAWGQLLQNAYERLLQDRLIEPANDNAKYFYLTLKQLDPGNAALSSVLHDLGTRLAAKARRALILGQYAAAKSWLEEEGAIGFSSAEVSSAQQDLDAALAKQNFMTNLVPANQLTLLKTVRPLYPIKARDAKTEGWVDVEFTVSETGKVQDVALRAASIPGVFEDAAVKAVYQWRYRPILRDAKPVPVRTQIRIRFSAS